jgi:hypothetical protein
MIAHWPQYIYLGVTCIAIGVHIAKSGEPLGGNFNPLARFIVEFITGVVLYYGGFFAPLGWGP